MWLRGSSAGKALENSESSPLFVQSYHQLRMKQAEDWITERYSAKVYAIVVEKNSFASVAFEKGQLGGGHFMARLPD